MTAPTTQGAPPPWHDDAERLGPALDRASAVLVVGRDGEAAAWAALGAARAQAARRRVAVADLVGDAQALAALGDADDGIGISDSVFYGVSLNRIARPADASGNLFVLPSGTEPVAVAEVLSSDRWPRLAVGFREAGALLVLAAQADAPGLDVLAHAVDGLVVVGDLAGLLPDAPAPLMVIPGPSARRGRVAQRAERPAVARPADAEPETERPTDAPVERSAAVPVDAVPAPVSVQPLPNGGVPNGGVVDSAPVVPATSDAGDARTPRAAAPAVAETAPRTRRGLALLAAAALAAAAGLWWYSTRGNTNGSPSRVAPPASSTARPPAPAPVVRDSAPGTAAAPGAVTPLTPANPADSAAAAAYSVHLVSANTPEGAALDPGVDQATLPVLALTPQLDNSAPWWRLFAGAYPTRQRAESLLVALQERGVLGAGSGTVVRAPYALLVADRLAAADAPARVEALSRRGVPTYLLSRGNGTVAVYAGAFERPADAEYLATALRAAGVTPVLVYRTGGSM